MTTTSTLTRCQRRKVKGAISNPLEIRERERHQVADAVNDIHLLRAVEQDANQLVEAGLGLDDDLTAGTAGRYGLVLQYAAGCTCSDSQRLDWHVWILGSGSKDGGALGTEACGVGRILLVAP